NCLAQAILAQRGSGSEPVALLLEHNASALVALLGVLKAGKFFVALDPSAPPARIASILGDSQASLMVTSTRLQSLAGEVEPAGCQQMNLDQLSPGPQAADPGLSRSPDSLAAIIYTSGSTGQPKGVIQSHRTLLHRFVSEANRFCFDAEDKLTMFHTLSTVAAMAHVLGGLLTGAALFPFDIRKKGVATVTDWLLQEGVTNFHSTPSLFRRWVDTLTGSEKFPQLRGIRLGGEATTPQDVALFKKHFTPGCILYVGLGGTESGTVSSYFFDQDSEVPSDRLPLGYPEEGVEVLLLDGDGQEVGFDRAGEIAVRSRYLSPGYWRKPELTQDRFRPDPQGGDARVYLTGDLGLRRPDGCLFHLGRKDYQVKIRGYRVELAEVELALHSIPDVKEAAVMAREDNLGTPRLVAYVVPGKKPGPTVTALRRALAEKLPSYMVPAAFVTLEALPLLPNGKMDRRALPPPENTRPQVETPFLAPRTPVEEELAGVWAQVLGLDQVGIDDNFLELGGDSLLAAQVISRVIRDFKVHLPLHALFAAPTVAQMAVVVAQRQANQASPEDVERLLAELEALSDEQARRIIEGEVVGPH
ncbi:MAG TPA: AMP-binding protein, partial [Dehalococcoidia bacterium]|nr:AMP-binding protein [Dehalococcoidia bacterium]